MQTRYYDPEIGRFINADGLTSTGQGILGNNMYAYCGNNPVNTKDPSGQSWKKVGQFFSKMWSSVKTWAKNTFGAGASTTKTIYSKTNPIIPEPSPIVVNTGTDITETVTESGDSSKPMSVYADGNLDAPFMSTAGIKVNDGNFTLNINLGLDDISVMGVVSRGNVEKSIGLRANVAKLKVGLECSSSVSWDTTTHTSYTNVSISGFGVATLYYLLTTGQMMPSTAPTPG